MARSLTKVDLWNRALMRIGESPTLQGETDTGTSAEVCQLVYDDCRRKVLESMRWPFAIKQVAISSASATRHGWEAAYVVPTDFINLIAWVGDDGRYEHQPYDIQMNDTADGWNIYTDISTTAFDVVEYVSDVEVVAIMPAQFIDCLVWLLASELALAIRKDAAMAGQMLNMYQQALHLAASQSLKSIIVETPETPSVAVRG